MAWRGLAWRGVACSGVAWRGVEPAEIKNWRRVTADATQRKATVKRGGKTGKGVCKTGMKRWNSLEAIYFKPRPAILHSTFRLTNGRTNSHSI